MNPPTISTPRNFIKFIFSLAILLLIALHTVIIRADTTDGSTPLALKPGAPAGSYALSDLDHVNPYNGSLNFRLPLLNIGGRGSAGFTMSLPIEQKWRINDSATYLIVYEDGGNGPLPDPQVTHHYSPSPNWWSGFKPGYGPGVLQGRVGQFGSQVCSDATIRAEMTLTRLTFTAPDGTEFELLDKQTGGAPASVGICDPAGLNRKKIFVTADGSAATFISDQDIVDYLAVPGGGGELFYPSGYLLLRDGTRYRFDNGTVTWLRDRNGNKITFNYDSFKRVTSIKDSLNREVTVAYATVSVAYDEITYKGFGGAPRTIRVNYANLQDTGSLRSGYSIQTYYQLFPISGSSQNTNYNPKIVRSITLPNNQQYQFQYNSYGELARVVLPTGGAFEYDHASGVAGDVSGITSGFEGSLNIYRRVVSRRVYADGSALESKMTFSNTESVPCSSCVVVNQFGSDGTTLVNQRRLFYEGAAINSFNLGPTDYSPWKEGREYQSESVAADGTTILQRSASTWQQPIAGASWPLTQAETNAAAKANNPQITQVVTTLEPSQANKVSKQTFGYDQYTNKTDVYEYDFGSGTAGSLVRRSHTDYLTSSYDTLNPSSSNPDLSLTAHIRNLPTQASVFDASGGERARSATEYDNYTQDGSDCLHSFHCPLLLRSNISGLDSLFSSGVTKRGNPTAATRYLMSNGTVTGSISSYTQYDVAGNPVRVLDPRSTLSNNIATTIEYDDRYGTPNNEARSNTVPTELTGFSSFAFPTKVVNALGHTAYAQFDYYLGQPVNGEDANAVIASGTFNDVLDRPTQIRRGIGTSAENQTTFAYNDTNRIITTSSDRDAISDNLLVSKIFYDKLGRTIETRQYEGGADYIATQTLYDSLGRPFKTSNPFRPQSESADWTIQAFDSLGRVISVTTPDSAVVSTNYSGNSVTVTDQAGKARKSITDGLGRLVTVFEDPAGFNYETSYLYDVLDDLVKVTQGNQQRFFMYDSLKRLLRARNPEQGTLASLNLSDPLTGNSAWSIGYQYDVAGNLTQKTDARGVVSTYAYDTLNRNTTIDYSDTGSINPDVKRFYDGATLGLGRFWYSYKGGDFSTGSNVEHTAIDSYDALGRPVVQRQLFKLNTVWSSPYQTSRAYNRAGAVISQTYPSLHTVAYSYDSAGRASSFTGTLGDNRNRTYSNTITYSPFGGLTREQFGTDTLLYQKSFYNVRGQLFDTRLSSVNDTWDWNRGRLLLYYSSNHLWGQSGTDNNGNMRFAETWIPPENATMDQADTLFEETYDYDALNRLTSVSEQRTSVAGGWGTWQQQFRQQYTYDRYGNRTIDTGQTWGTGINNKPFAVDPNNTNRLVVPSGQSGVMSYDLAGNLINDTYTGAGAREYDAENKMTRAWGGNNQWQEYTYNADGQRTRRKVDGQETWQIYGMDSELLAEYTANGPTSFPQKEYGYRNGQLLVTTAPGANTIQNVAWTNTTAVSVSGNTLTKTGAAGWNAGAVSTQSISSGDGYVEFTATETNLARMCGLGNGDSGQNYTDIEFGIQLTASNGANGIWIFESGTSRGNFGTYSAGDKFRVSVEAGVVKYYKLSGTTQTLLYTSTVAPTYPLLVDSSLYSSAATLTGVVIANLTAVNFTSATGVAVTGNSLMKTGAAGWNAGAVSTQTINSGDGYVEFTASETNLARMCGLGNGDSGQNYTDVEFAIQLTASDGTNGIWIIESGTLRGNFGTYSAGDKFRVAVESGVVKYRKNGTLLYTSSVTPTYPLLVDTSLYSTGSTVSNILFSGAPAQVQWLVSDHLGTPRMIVDQTGKLASVKRHDYLPFGEELFTPTGGRNASLGYAAGDGVRQQFTQKERDAETGLDYFGARYHASIQGRFTSVDPLMASGRGASPQSWNRYSYVLNNPLNLVDPTGLQDDPPQTFTINNPCEYGTAGCNPVKLGTVTVTTHFDSAPLETTDLSATEGVTPIIRQIASDTVIGAAKWTYNALYGTANLVNAPIDYGLSFFTDFQFGQTELYQPSTPGERNAMFGMDIGTFMVGAYGTFAETEQVTNTVNAVDDIQPGTQVYRVFGGDSNPFGGSWTPVNPNTVSNYRAAAGLPEGNTGRFVLEGILRDTTKVRLRASLPGAGGAGGLPELLVPNPAKQITLTRVSGVNPPF